MREPIFRFLAALLALGMIWALVSENNAARPLMEAINLAFWATIFGVFALLGTRPAEALLCFASYIAIKYSQIPRILAPLISAVRETALI